MSEHDYNNHYYGDPAYDAYYNPDPATYDYHYGDDRRYGHATRNSFRDGLWAIYCIAGGDPDNNDRFYCNDFQALRAAIDSVKQLRRDYDEPEDQFNALD